MACSVVVTQEGKYGRGPDKFECSRCGRDFGWLDKEPQDVACRVEEEELAARRASDEDVAKALLLVEFHDANAPLALRLAALPWIRKVSE